MDTNPTAQHHEHHGSSGTFTHHAHHYNLRKAGHHLRHLAHPNGKKVHIAQNPAEAEELRRTLSPDDSSDGDIDVCLHGSEQHLEILRSIQSHHHQRREALRQQHGDLFTQAEAIALELETLSDELRQVTDRSVQFDANFNRFGYSATIRTHGPSSQPHSSSVSIASGKTGPQTLEDFHALRFQGQPLKPWRKPIVRQYFHQNLLWRAQDDEQTASYELFIDLLYVGIIAISGDNAAEEANGEALLRFAISFMMGWQIWFDLLQLMNWFDQDDLMRRIYVLFELACLVGFTVNISQFQSTTYTPFVSLYLAARLATAGYYLWMACHIKMVRWSLILHAALITLPAALWIGSIHGDETQKLVLIWIALVLDILGTPISFIVRPLLSRIRSCKNALDQAFAFVPAINIEHRIDRTGSFVTLIFGYSVVSLLYSSAARIGLNAFLGKAILGLLQAFALNTLYFEVDSFNLHIHAIRRHAVSGMAWTTLHLPLILAYVLAGAALSRIVLTDDAPGTTLKDLAEASLLKSPREIASGLRWFYTAGLGLGMLCLNGIAFTHVYRDVSLPPGSRFPVMFKRPVRLGIRFAIAVTILFLGFADSLNSLELITTTTGLVLLALIVEVVGNAITGCQRHLKRRRSDLSGSTLDEKDHCPRIRLRDWWSALKEDCCREKKCHYRAKVHGKRELEDMVGQKNEQSIRWEEIGEKGAD